MKEAFNTHFLRRGFQLRLRLLGNSESLRNLGLGLARLDTNILQIGPKLGRDANSIDTHKKDSESVVSAVIREITKLLLHLRQSLTGGRGMEMAKHRELHLATNMIPVDYEKQYFLKNGTV